MSIMIGQPIDARELEQATSQWSPERFASMCDALVWVASGRQFPGFPSFTMRVNAPDRGVDAEWHVELPEDAGGLPSPIVGPGWNVFQYKKRDLIAQDRRRIISNLRSSLRKAIATVMAEHHRKPDRYIIFVNVDLKHDQTAVLKKAVVEGYNGSCPTEVVIIDAGGLAALLNNYPHLRETYFAPLSFKTWEEANRSHRTQKLFGFDVALVGREDLLNQLRSLVDDPRVRVIVVTGHHDIGKSRLVLEATSHCPHDVVFALDPRSMRLDDYRKLVAEQREVVCIIEDPDPDKVEALINEGLGIERLKLLITLPSSGYAADPSYGTDKRIQYLSLSRLSDEDSRKLLSATGKRLDFGVESWILDRAGGNPGILLAATSVGEKLRAEGGDFEDAVGREFEGRIKTALGDLALKCTELLSILTQVGIDGKFEAEIKIICEIFGEGWRPPEVISALEGLEQTGVAIRKGSFAEVTIPMLANYLVAKLLRGRTNELFLLFGRLDELATVRFLRRLSQVRGGVVERFWDALFDPSDPAAPFGNFRSASRKLHMLRFMAGAVPGRTIHLLESGLIGTTHEERLAISDEPRRELVWALEQLLFRVRTSRSALGLIWLLAEAENEKWGNNATGVLSECFHPLHSQMPLPLDERLAVLREFTSSPASKEGKLVAIRAASRALGHGMYSLRHSSGVEPLDKRPVFTLRDAYDYVRDLVDHFFRLAETEENEVAEEAVRKLPTLVFELGVQGQPKEALERFKRLVEWAKSEKQGLDIFSLSENIETLRESFKDHIEKPKITNERKTEFQEYLKEAEYLKTELEKGSFAIRLKRWATGWSREDHEKIVVNGQETSKSELELSNLAKETVAAPELLSGEVLLWLLSSHAQKSRSYFFHLGHQDLESRLRPRIEELGAQSGGDIAFSAYWGGWARNDRAGAEKRLLELANLNLATGEAIARAVAYLRPSPLTLELLERGILKGQIRPKAGAAILYGDWVTDVSAEHFLRLLRTIIDDQPENAAIAIDVLGRWLHHRQPLEGELAEFAWRCLEAAPPVTSNEAYDCEGLAAKLAESDIERGFRLLEKLLMQPYERKSWNPIDRYGAQENKFWAVLHQADRCRSLRVVFSVAAMDSLRCLRVSWDLEDILDQENDADILMELVIESEDQAAMVAESITTAKPGFWPIFFKIVEKYPHSLNIQNGLTHGIEQMGTGALIRGPISLHLEGCRKEVERVLNDPATPAVARSWLREFLSRMEGEIAQHIVWEYDEDVNSLRRYIEDRNSPERVWAMGRVLKYADLKDIRRLLTVEDIAEALPQVDLPEKKRKALERALEVWHGGS